MMLSFLRKKRALALLKDGFPRRIRVHSVTPCPEGAATARYHRIAFEFLDPPGPWSMQFFEVSNYGDGPALEPGAEAKFYESEDGARSRLMVTGEGRQLLPR